MLFLMGIRGPEGCGSGSGEGFTASHDTNTAGSPSFNASSRVSVVIRKFNGKIFRNTLFLYMYLWIFYDSPI